MIRALISPYRPKGLALRTRLGKIIALLDRVQVAYKLPVPDKKENDLTGCGNLRVEIRDEQLHCRVLGDVFRPTDYEFVFHSFWLTRRGMILMIVSLAGESRQKQPFIRPAGFPAPKLKAEAVHWLRSFWQTESKPK